MADVRGLGDEGQAPAAPRRRTLTPLWTLKSNQLLGAAAFACLAKYLPVYYADINIPLNVIGILTSSGMVVTFIGQLFWSAVIDYLGEFKRTLVGTQILGTATLFLYTIPAIQQSTILVFCVTVVNTFLMSTGGSIIDALCMKVLQDYKDALRPDSTPRTVRGAGESYGDQRLYSAVGWGGMSLIMGAIIDRFGMNAMFVAFAVLQTLNIGIVTIFMPGGKPQPPLPTEGVEDQAAAAAAAPAENAGGICRPKVLWFFANLLIYGIAMCLIENFLFIYLIQEFDNTPNVLLGANTAIMCFFEIPVFKWLGPYLERQPVGSDTGMVIVLLACQIITALRCWIYILIPRDQVSLALTIAPLHGICFAAMWAASMEYGKRIATSGNLAKMTSLVNGLYYNVSMGIGSIFWGAMVEKPPSGLGFTGSFISDIWIIAVWAVIWQVGLRCMAKPTVSLPDGQERLAGRDLPAGA